MEAELFTLRTLRKRAAQQGGVAVNDSVRRPPASPALSFPLALPFSRSQSDGRMRALEGSDLAGWYSVSHEALPIAGARGRWLHGLEAVPHAAREAQSVADLTGVSRVPVQISQG